MALRSQCLARVHYLTVSAFWSQVAEGINCSAGNTLIGAHRRAPCGAQQNYSRSGFGFVHVHTPASVNRCGRRRRRLRLSQRVGNCLREEPQLCRHYADVEQIGDFFFFPKTTLGKHATCMQRTDSFCRCLKSTLSIHERPSSAVNWRRKAQFVHASHIAVNIMQKSEVSALSKHFTSQYKGR